MSEVINSVESISSTGKNAEQLLGRLKPISEDAKKANYILSKHLFGFPKKLLSRTSFFSKRASMKPSKSLIFCSTLLVVISISLGVYALKLSTGGHSKLTSKGFIPVVSSKKAITPSGPSQTNSLFSTYPAWAQNFAADTTGKLDSTYWEVNQGPAINSNHEAEYYTNNSSNLRISNGALTLEATKQPEPEGYSYGSARIDTSGKVSFLYGRIDITAELPDSVGSWPAAWFLPANSKYENLSPASETDRYLNGGEMDLIEEVGFQPNTEYGVVHTLSDLGNPNGVGAFNQITIPSNNANYNTYTLLWTPDSITYEINNTPFFTYSRPSGADYTTWPFDQPFYLILNLALGGSWGGQDTAQFPGNGIDDAALPVSMNIKSIYYYPYTAK